MKSKVYTVTLVLIALITVVAFIGWFMLRPAPYVMQGTVEATSYKVSSKVPGRVDSLTVRRGQRVVRGQFLYGISSPEVLAKLTQAEAARSAATAMQEKVDAGARKQQIQQAYEMWQKSLAGLDLARKTYDRVKNLYEQGVVPAQKLDEAQASLQSMQTTSTAARAAYTMAVEGRSAKINRRRPRWWNRPAERSARWNPSSLKQNSMRRWTARCRASSPKTANWSARASRW